jgi:ribosome-binding protein aMBF1 (putative translation factor)
MYRDHGVSPMDEAKRARLKAKGWVETTVDELFGLDEIDRQVVELRVRLAREIRRRRESAGLCQSSLASRIESSQPRVAKIEGGQAGVSLDLQVSAFFATGGSLDDLAGVVAGTN